MTNGVDRISMAARMNRVLIEMMGDALDRDRVLAQVRDIEEGCIFFGIRTEGKSLGRLKIELRAAIDKELGR